jgi:hypothetical protein
VAIKLANLYVMVPIAFVPPAALLSYLASPLQNEKTPKYMVGKDLCLVGRAGIDVSCSPPTTYVESAQSQWVWYAICTRNLTKM